MLKQWEKRVIAFEIVYSLLMKEQLFFNEDEYQNVNKDVIKLVNYIINNFNNIKSKIISNLNENWSWDRLLTIDKSIIIVAYAEFNVFKTDKKIVIDQAIITSKKYSDEKSYKFINFILDKLI